MSEHPLSAVVDDEASVRGALQPLLRLEGCRTVVFASAEDLLHAGPLQDIACLIVDVRMPQMSGLELQRQLATTHCPIPLIFITAHGDAAARAQALRAGAVDFLYKPFRDEALLGAIRSALRSSQEGGAGAQC